MITFHHANTRGSRAGRLRIAHLWSSMCHVSFLAAPDIEHKHKLSHWKGLDDEPRMVLHKHSDRSFFYFNLRLVPNAKLVFLQSSGDAFCTTMCQQARWTKLSLLQAKFLFERSHPTSNLRMSGQLEVAHTEDEIAEKHFLFSV